MKTLLVNCKESAECALFFNSFIYSLIQYMILEYLFSMCQINLFKKFNSYGELEDHKGLESFGKKKRISDNEWNYDKQTCLRERLAGN